MILKSLWEGENNTVDSIGGIDADFDDPSYDTGVEGSCFKLKYTTLNIKHTDLEGSFQIDFYLKFTGATGPDDDPDFFAITKNIFPIFNYYYKTGGAYNAFTLNGNQQYTDLFPLFHDTFTKISITYIVSSHRWELYVNDELKTPVSYQDTEITFDSSPILIYGGGKVPIITGPGKCFIDTISLYDAIQHIAQLTCLPATEKEFAIEYKWYIDLYESGDWNGTPGNISRFFSDTPGTMAEIVAPVVEEGIHVTNSYWKDLKNTGEIIDATDPSNTVINCIGINGPTPASSNLITLIYQD